MKQVNREYHSETSAASPITSWLPNRTVSAPAPASDNITPSEPISLYQKKKNSASLPAVPNPSKKAMLASTVLRTFRRASGAMSGPTQASAAQTPVVPETTP